MGEALRYQKLSPVEVVVVEEEEEEDIEEGVADAVEAATEVEDMVEVCNNNNNNNNLYLYSLLLKNKISIMRINIKSKN